MKKRIILPSVMALSILVIALQAKNVFADDFTNYPPIVQKIAERFNLDVDEVEQVFGEERDEKRAEKFARFADMLDDLVSEGKLTESQRNAILDKHEDIQDAIEGLMNLTAEERNEKIQSLHGEFKNWLQEQGIEEELLGGFGKGLFGPGNKRVHKGKFMVDGAH